MFNIFKMQYKIYIILYRPNLLPHCVDSIVPIISRIINLSLSSGVFSKQLKSALVKPLLKKSNLDPNDLKNYCPISNLSFLSKLIERVIAARLSSHLSSHNLISRPIIYSCSSLFASLVP